MHGSTPGARLAAAAAAAIALLTAGCAGSVPGTAVVSRVSGIGPTTFATGKLDTGYLPPLGAQWIRAHPRQKVTVFYLPVDSDEQHAQLIENLQAKSDVYDVMSLNVIWTAEFASNGWISPISPDSG